jgi:hypothetical protein
MGRPETKKLILTNYSLFYLNEDEIADPFLAIREFFTKAHMPEVRDMLWLSFKTNVTGSFPQGDLLTQQERYDIILLHEQFIRLVEAAHLLNEKRILEMLYKNSSKIDGNRSAIWCRTRSL